MERNIRDSSQRAKGPYWPVRPGACGVLRVSEVPGRVRLGLVGVEAVLLRAGGVGVESGGLAQRLELGGDPGDEEGGIEVGHQRGVSCTSTVAVPPALTWISCSFSPSRSCQSR